MKHEELVECITRLVNELAGLKIEINGMSRSVTNIEKLLGKWDSEEKHRRESEDESFNRIGERLGKHAGRLSRLESRAGIVNIEDEQAV